MFETNRLLLRVLTVEDAKPLTDLWTDPDVTCYMGGPRNYDKLYQDFIADANPEQQPAFDLWPAIEKATGQVVGHCGVYDKEVNGRLEHELIYVFAKAAWGKGYATEAGTAVKNYVFQHLGLTRLIALIDPENVASARVAEKVGLHYEQDVVRPGGKVMKVYAIERNTLVF